MWKNSPKDRESERPKVDFRTHGLPDFPTSRLILHHEIFGNTFFLYR
jgi:hypothetical protein